MFSVLESSVLVTHRKRDFGYVSSTPALRFQILIRRQKKDCEMVVNHCRCSGLAWTSQNRAVGWEKECDPSRDEPSFCLWVTKLMCIFYGQVWLGRLFLYDQQKTNRKSDRQKAGSSESCFMVIVTKETNSLVFMCSADGRSGSLRLRWSQNGTREKKGWK